MNVFINILTKIGVRDIIDILIVAIVFYRGLLLIKETRAEQLVKGIVIIYIFAKISGWIQLYTINSILESTITVGVIAIIIVFQPELRRVLEIVGRSKIVNKNLKDIRNAEVDVIINNLLEAMELLAKEKIGALIVVEQNTGLNEVVETGVQLNSDISVGLLINIFTPNTPLHDGAVIIKGRHIKAAGCFLPLTENQNLPKDLGTRHRAALGMSEKSDAIIFTVSEETGGISFAKEGKLTRFLDQETIKQILIDIYNKSDNMIFGAIWEAEDEVSEE